VRADSLLRIQNEAAIFMRMAKDCPAVLDPLYSGLPESIFHADPHAGNLMVQTQKHAPPTLVLLDWSQAGRLSAPLRHALIALCLYCVTGDEASP
jgi:predicted unusual protein kinase regulating ubiquinone biosynthesis (AarF/ABC1/UbiB family)